MIELNLLHYQEQLAIRSRNGKAYLFDPIRQREIVVGPEELVRQLLLHFFIVEKGYNKNRIAVEKGLRVGERQKRVDLLLYDAHMNPWMLVECKAPEVPITQDTMEQIAWYNMPLQVKYLLVTNGVTTVCCQMDYLARKFTYLPDLPAYP